MNILPMTEIWNTNQYSMVHPEGVFIVDGAMSCELHDVLMNQIDDLANTQEFDYHPHSKEIVRDLVHPALYAYIKGISKVETMNEVKPCKAAFAPREKKEAVARLGRRASLRPPPEPEKDYWGRKYEISSKYQWLSTYFDIDTVRNCKICDYINNLAPRSAFTGMYSSLE